MVFTAFTIITGFAIGIVSILWPSGKNGSESEEQTPDDEPVEMEVKVPKFNEFTVEICLSDLESAERASCGGATSIELCSARYEGGITPRYPPQKYLSLCQLITLYSVGLIEEVVNKLKSTETEVHVLIRPRGGNFNYTSSEFDVIVRDVLASKQAGADGVVVGCLTPSMTVDVERLVVLRTLSQGMTLTFHRAFDLCVDPNLALEQIIAAGCDRVLTSAQSSSAASPQGLTGMKALATQAKGRINIIAAAGIKATNVSEVVSSSEVSGVHAGSAVTTRKHSNYPNSTNITHGHESVKIGLGGASSDEGEFWEAVDSDLVKALADAALFAWNRRKSLPISGPSFSVEGEGEGKTGESLQDDEEEKADETSSVGEVPSGSSSSIDCNDLVHSVEGSSGPLSSPCGALDVSYVHVSVDEHEVSA